MCRSVYSFTNFIHIPPILIEYSLSCKYVFIIPETPQSLAKV